jgi:hypothetical protein
MVDRRSRLRIRSMGSRTSSTALQPGRRMGHPHRYDAFIEALARQDLKPEEETVALYHQLTGRQQTAAV